MVKEEFLGVRVGGNGIVWGRKGRQVEVGLGMGDRGPNLKRAMEGLKGHKRGGGIGAGSE